LKLCLPTQANSTYPHGRQAKLKEKFSKLFLSKQKVLQHRKTKLSLVSCSTEKKRVSQPTKPFKSLVKAQTFESKVVFDVLKNRFEVHVNSKLLNFFTYLFIA